MLDELIGGPDHLEHIQVLRGRVKRAPSSATDSMTVVIPAYSEDQDYEIPSGQWTPRGPTPPAVGTWCVVLLDSDGDAWVPTLDGVSEFPSGGGSGTGDLSYVHSQGAGAATWTVVHGLHKYPAVEVVDNGLTVLIPDVHYDSVDQLTLTFGAPVSGKAFVN
jgi:hypothetical protein